MRVVCTAFLHVNLVLELIMNDLRGANFLSNATEIITSAWGCMFSWKAFKGKANQIMRSC